jgi:hypothetical protein
MIGMGIIEVGERNAINVTVVSREINFCKNTNINKTTRD